MRRFALLLVACNNHHESGAIDQQRADQLFDQIVIDTPPGMSGLAVDERGVLWGVPERDRTMCEITLGPPVTIKRYPIEGVPDGLDTEGLAWLGNGRFAIGTEGGNAPTASILFAELRDGHVVVTRTRELTSAELGVKLTINHGAEGACGHDGDVLVGIEAIGTLPDGTRYAPIARLRGETLTVSKLRLTTKTGKISSLDCTIDPDGTAHVWAIERHYSVSRILRFSVPLAASEITPTVEIDLAPVLNDSLNLESIVQLPDGRLVAINDNQGSTITGPTELLVFHPRRP
jgi:hypothetical protein